MVTVLFQHTANAGNVLYSELEHYKRHRCLAAAVVLIQVEVHYFLQRLQVSYFIIDFGVRLRLAVVTKEQATDTFIYYLPIWTEVAQKLGNRK